MLGKCRVLLIILLLFIISFIIIIMKGNTYVIEGKIDNIKDINDINVSIEQDKEIIKIVNKEFKNNTYKLTLKGVNKGKAYLIINDYMEIFYVHNFNIITRNEFFGKCSGDIIIPISFIILILYILYIFIKKYKISIKDNIYKYKNIFYLGLILFLVFLLINNLIQLFNYNGLIYSIDSIVHSFHLSIILLPIIFISFIIVTISNIKLLIKEGLSIKNILGVLMGIFLCFLTILPDVMYRFIFNNLFISIHDTGSISYYIYTFIENTIYIVNTYLECILFGTIIIAIRTSFYKAKLDKDYIIILGCKIRSDGTLTPLLKGRVDKAIDFYKLQKDKTGKELIFIPSGGKGVDEVISEGDAIKNYLIEQGISKKNIIVENNSKNTYENIKYSYNLIKDKTCKIAISTTKYHVFRAGITATKQNIKIEVIGSNTKLYFFINAFIREFIATLFSEVKKHIRVLVILNIINLLILFIIYLSNNL